MKFFNKEHFFFFVKNQIFLCTCREHSNGNNVVDVILKSLNQTYTKSHSDGTVFGFQYNCGCCYDYYYCCCCSYLFFIFFCFVCVWVCACMEYFVCIQMVYKDPPFKKKKRKEENTLLTQIVVLPRTRCLPGSVHKPCCTILSVDI